MKSCLFFALTLLVQSIAVFGSSHYPYQSTFYGCPKECHTQERPKCSHGLPDNQFFVALHPKYFRHEPYPYCDHYYVGMIIDSKAQGKYKMIRAKVVDQCGSCAETQVDLSQTAFETIAKSSTGVVEMVYVIVDKNSNEIIDGPVYSSSALKRFSESQGVSRETIIGSFKQAAKAMNKDGAKGLSDYPWKNGKFSSDDDHEERKHKEHKHEEHKHEEKHEEHKHEEKKTTRKTTTRKTTTTTTTVRKTTTTHKPVVKTTTAFAPVVKTTTAFAPVAKTTTVAPIVVVKTTSVAPVAQPTVANKPAPKPVEKPEEKKEESKPVETKPIEIKQEEELDDFDKKNGGVSSSVGVAGVIGVCGCAAGVGLFMLKKQSPQKYDDLKQKFPEAFGTVKRSLTRGATTIKRGVSRSVSRRNSPAQNTTPLPASYTFTLNSEDGLPRVALYDDPYPTKTHGSQHW